MADNHDVETTGHQWDDEEGFPLKEYNNPLPKWWLYSFYATILWALGYWVLYPTWPLADGFTKGVLGWSMHGEYQKEMDEAKAKQKVFNDQMEKLPLKEIVKNNQLLQYAISGGKALFGDNCAPCHGSGGVGVKAGGFPTLADDDWLFGGDLETIHETISNGRTGMMPAHLNSAGGNFTPAQVADLTAY
ncbi:MAG: cytochrome-c oxidase, cbb3-type subunit III, partial [Magnetococcales bacterium]|nr:cytochrome-c oxidase, cbb3-type subunit III [Magnetococcales bacterium]